MMSLTWRLLAAELLGVTYPWVNVIPSEPFDKLRTGTTSEGSPTDHHQGMKLVA